MINEGNGLTDYENSVLGIRLKINYNWTIEEKGISASRDVMPSAATIQYNLPSVVFFSPQENGTDRFLENVKVAMQILPRNLTLIDLIDHIYYYYLDFNTCGQYPSDTFKQIITDITDSISLIEYVMAFVDFYKACIPSFQLRNFTNINATGNPTYEIMYSFDLNSKVEKLEYITNQLYIQHDARIYIVSYNALNGTYPHYFPIFQKMINSLKIS